MSNLQITSSNNVLTIEYNSYSTEIGKTKESYLKNNLLDFELGEDDSYIQMTFHGGETITITYDPLSANRKIMIVDSVNSVTPTSQSNLYDLLQSALVISSGTVTVDTTGLATSASQTAANSSLNSIDTKLSNQATATKQDSQTALLTTISNKDFATQTTLAALLAKVIAAPSTEAKQDAQTALLTAIDADTSNLSTILSTQTSGAQKTQIVDAGNEAATVTSGRLDTNATISQTVTTQYSQKQAYRVFVPSQAVGASKVYFDIFNATGSGRTLNIISITPIVSGAVAVTGIVAVDLFLTRTTSVGTGGTAATANGTTLTAMTISPMSASNTALPAQVTGRLSPSGGAAAGAVISWASVFTEETNAATYFTQTIDLIQRSKYETQPLVIAENTGFRVVQGTVASVGNIGFDIIFEMI